MPAEDILYPQAVPPPDPLVMSPSDDSLRLPFHIEGAATVPIEVEAVSS